MTGGLAASWAPGAHRAVAAAYRSPGLARADSSSVPGGSRLTLASFSGCMPDCGAPGSMLLGRGNGPWDAFYADAACIVPASSWLT